MKEGFQIGLSGADENCDTISFSGRREDWSIRAAKVPDEIACAKRFCGAEHPKLTQFTKMPTDSEVDVLAESPDKKEKSLKLQVAGLWPEDFLQRFGDQDVIDGKISREDLMDLIRASVQKKLKKKSSSQDVILLIDTKPADLRPQCLQRIRSDERLRQEVSDTGNFCEIWVCRFQRDCPVEVTVPAMPPSIDTPISTKHTDTATASSVSAVLTGIVGLSSTGPSTAAVNPLACSLHTTFQSANV